jgi:hypothetical protein
MVCVAMVPLIRASVHPLNQVVGVVLDRLDGVFIAVVDYFAQHAAFVFHHFLGDHLVDFVVSMSNTFLSLRMLSSKSSDLSTVVFSSPILKLKSNEKRRAFAHFTFELDFAAEDVYEFLYDGRAEACSAVFRLISIDPCENCQKWFLSFPLESRFPYRVP